MNLTWQRALPTLVTLSFLGLAAGLLLMVPDGEVFQVMAYLAFVALVAGLLYVVGIRTVDSTFSPALFLLAFALKLLAGVARYWMLDDLYGGVGDAISYYSHGQYVAGFFQRLDFSLIGSYVAGGEGTTNLAFLAGGLYTLFPPSLIGSYLFFAMLAFTGSVFFYRGFRIAFPEVPPGWYRVAVFFLPSVLFWPSSLGKEAWVFFGSGLVAYGLARFARQARPMGLVETVVGLLLVGIIRPHFAAAMVLAAGAGFLLFYRPMSERRLAVWLVGAVVFLVLGIFLLQSATEFLGLGPLSEISWEEVEALYDFRQRVTSKGGSGYVPPAVLTLVGPLLGIITVLFRPFPWEAHNPQALFAAVESVAWLAFFLYRRKVFWARLRSLRGDPWLAFNAAYTVILILALTTLSNFGMLARQRVAFLPFLWVLFA